MPQSREDAERSSIAIRRKALADRPLFGSHAGKAIASDWTWRAAAGVYSWRCYRAKGCHHFARELAVLVPDAKPTVEHLVRPNWLHPACRAMPN